MVRQGDHDAKIRIFFEKVQLRAFFLKENRKKTIMETLLCLHYYTILGIYYSAFSCAGWLVLVFEPAAGNEGTLLASVDCDGTVTLIGVSSTVVLGTKADETTLRITIIAARAHVPFSRKSVVLRTPII